MKRRLKEIFNMGDKEAVENKENTSNEEAAAAVNEAQPEQENIEATELTEVEELRIQIKEKEDQNLRLLAEFDNFRKRAAKERIDWIKTAGQDVIKSLLPVMDDLDRAEKNIQEANDITGLKTGLDLIKGKLTSTLAQKGLERMIVLGEKFDPELHEAITEIEAPSEEEKGTILDVVENGYTLNEKIIRYPKVVIGK